MGYFWREYLFYCNDSGYPLLREKLAPTRLFWDGRKHLWGGGFEDTMPAVAVVGRWAALTMPYAAEGNRPIQPVTIAHEHNGNCGEMQDLLQAAARTALIPCGGVLDINEDHVWNEIWWDSLFIPYANDPTTHIADSGVAYERKYGGSKNCSGIWDWRNDGWQRSQIGTYSDVCTLTVQVYDSCLRPVAGQIVQLSSEDWYGGMANCFFGVTDRNGRYTTTLGDLQNYYLTMTGPVGGVIAGKIIDSAAAVPGASFFYACTLSGTARLAGGRCPTAARRSTATESTSAIRPGARCSTAVTATTRAGRTSTRWSVSRASSTSSSSGRTDSTPIGRAVRSARSSSTRTRRRRTTAWS